MSELYKKIIAEAMGAQRADVETVKKKRGTQFTLSDAQPYVDAVKKMTVASGQSAAVIDLHKTSVTSHFDALSKLTKAIRPEDDPFVEHYQTPVVLEILCDEDKKFEKSLEAFVKQIGKSEALIGRESARRYAGFYGPTCVVDFALIPGSTSNVVNQILKTTDIPTDHKQAILAAKSWGMNTSYGVGEVFATQIEAGDTLADASAKEVKQLQAIYESPVKAQAELMDGAGHTSFDVRKYMEDYRRMITPAVKAAIDDGVHYGNIATIPAYCVGDIAHHIAQSTFNMCKDDVIMATIEAVTEVMQKTLDANVEKFKSEYDILSVVTGSSAAATEYILELDGFNAPMIVDLLTKRFHNLVQLNPTRGAAAELHNCDFMDMLYRGWKIIDRARRTKAGSNDLLAPKVAGCTIDLSPIHENEILMNPQWYAYPACAITVRASALMRLSDYPCLLTSEPVTATMMTNIIALHKETAAAPVRSCKDCAAACLVDFRHQYCEYRDAV
ncbi:hypothetical protein J2T58_000644 [Methanocalculus alkaliphilus]|uniref:DUF2193 domain-containing protein n=1 Tax=Methanocalculus alkaliphilus TaxID=768730 RepID=UPI00209D752A|nr:DUF2193 domain-containing protein [Methanocalculus alkaliphilus]MCP1714799.1 hypothetical protein [Methanocalculus alkaliphilus]